MAHLLRLIAFALALGVLAPTPVAAQVVLRSQALANCEASRAFAAGPIAQYQASGVSSQLLPCRDIPNASPAGSGAWRCEYTFAGSTQGCDNWFPNARTLHPYNTPDPTCESLNSSNPPGPRLTLAENSGPKCVGGCELDIVGDPIETVQGRVQGQPVVYYRFNQEYTGNECTANPEEGENTEDLEEVETPDGKKQCNASLGVCVDENGNNEYCTFNSDGTPSACVPAIDYDGDGVSDDNDTMPDDDTNGQDEGEGDEKDNVASGGAKCLHEGGQPPTCRGDAIQCNILLQQYLARCASEKVASGAVSPGIACSITAPLTCTNMSPGDCWEKAIQKKAACAAERIADGLDGGAPIAELPGTEGGQAWADGQGGNAPGSGEGIDLDDSGWLSDRSCPSIPTVNVFGYTLSFQTEVGRVCNFFSITSALVLLFAAFWAARIIGEA